MTMDITSRQRGPSLPHVGAVITPGAPCSTEVPVPLLPRSGPGEDRASGRGPVGFNGTARQASRTKPLDHQSATISQLRHHLPTAEPGRTSDNEVVPIGAAPCRVVTREVSAGDSGATAMPAQSLPHVGAEDTLVHPAPAEF